MSLFQELVKKELANARKHHGKQASLHEGAAILPEEYEEVWDIVKMKSHKRNMNNLLKELVQVASCAQKTAEDLVIPLIKKKK